jgi:single-stranded-DNA-specific exonuclease
MPMSRPARWLFPKVEESRVAALSAELGLSRPAAQVLVRRGYGAAASAQNFLAASLDDLHDPFALRDMDRAVARLRAAIARQEKLLLYGDYDVDGTSSVVMLSKALSILGSNPGFHVPHRLRDGYGMRTEVVEEAAARGVSLIVSVDTGIRAAEVVRHAAARGIDVIVTDHHLPETQLPPAVAVLNPNRSDCAYPEKNLCGAGVAFKLIDGLLRALDWPQSRCRPILKSLLKIAAVATVADVVPLTGENRIIVRHGLAGLSRIRNPGLRALMRVAGLPDGEAPTARQVAFQIAPRINAAGRMADASDVIELFLTEDEQRAEALARELNARNLERQQTEQSILRHIEEHLLSEPVDDTHAALVFAGRHWHKGVAGIVAGRIAERYGRPAFVLDISPDGVAQGSGRSIPQFHLLEALESMQGLFLQFGGHRQAAGVTLPADRVDEFRARLNRYAAARLSPVDFQPVLAIDAESRLAEIDDRAASDLLSMAPFGFGNPAPILAARGVELRETPRLMKEKHLRLRVFQDGRALDLKAWNFASRAEDLTPGRRIDIAFSIEEDPWSAARGYSPYACTLRDFRESVDRS